MKFPRHLTLTLEHNGHKSNYESVAGYCEHRDTCADEWVSEGQRRKAIETNELWECQWYPDTPIGSCSLFAADLEVLLAALAAIADKENA